MTPASHGLSEQTYERLRAEFVDWLESELSSIEQCIEEKSSPSLNEAGEDAEIRLMRMVHNIKGSASAFGFSTVSAISHRMEDFISATALHLEDDRYKEFLLKFSDEMKRVSDLSEDPTEDIKSLILKQLPTSTDWNSDEKAGSQKDIERLGSKEALIISPSRTISAIARKVFETLGHSVMGCKTGMEGINLAIASKPDFIVVSTIVEDISGPDLARAISSMKSMSKTKILLVSNLDKSHPDMKDIPEAVDVIYQAADFPMTLFRQVRGLSN